jgi:hypothetical protein
VRNVTIQWSILAEPLRNAYKWCGGRFAGKACTSNAVCGAEKCEYASEGFASLVSDLNGGSIDRVSFHHNLFYGSTMRNPEIGAAGTYHLVNNVLAVPLYQTSLTAYHSGDVLGVDYERNYHLTQDQPNQFFRALALHPTRNPGARFKIFLRENLDTRYKPVSVVGNDCDLFAFLDTPYPSWGSGPGSPGWPTACQSYGVSIPNVPGQPIPTTSAEQAFADVLNGAGATLPCRDKTDGRVVQNVRLGISRVIDRPEDTGPNPWPDLTQVCR